MLTFKKSGKENTDAVIDAALSYAWTHNINKIVVASVTGETAVKLADCGKEIIVVTHHTGFIKPGEQEFPVDLRNSLQKKGMSVLTTTHFLAGADRALNNKFKGIYPAEIMAYTLRILGQGLKVCIEIAIMANDAGYIDPAEDVISIAGTGRGADTAVLIRPAHSNNFFDTVVKEIICMPKR